MSTAQSHSHPSSPPTCHGRWMSPEFEPGLVSVIVPTYNRAHLIIETLDSVVAQTYRPIELLIIDDGSTDNTVNVVRQWQQDHRQNGFTTHFFHHENRGAPAARNLGLIESRGEFIQFLDSDDLLKSDKLWRQVDLLNLKTDTTVAHEGWAQGRSWGDSRIFERHQQSDMVESLLCGKWNPPFSYLTRRSTVLQTGPWDETLAVAQDFDFFLRISITNRYFSYSNGIAGLFVWHSGDRVSRQHASVRAPAIYRILHRAEVMLREQCTFSPVRASAMAESYWKMAKACVNVHPEMFSRGINEALRVYPGWRPNSVPERTLSRIAGFRTTAILSRHSRRLHYNVRRHARKLLYRDFRRTINK